VAYSFVGIISLSTDPTRGRPCITSGNPAPQFDIYPPLLHSGMMPPSSIPLPGLQWIPGVNAVEIQQSSGLTIDVTCKKNLGGAA